MIFQVEKPGKQLHGEITLAYSKSLSNRALIIRALSDGDFPITNLSDAADTQTLMKLLVSRDMRCNTGAAGTTFRFLTAYFATQPGTKILTGTPRLKERPVGPLVSALQQLGADIDYLEKQGYPPLKIASPKPDFGTNNRVTIPAHTSSQFISALLLIAPILPKGLQLHLSGEIVSQPYIEMTIQLMRYFGVKSNWQKNVISIPARPYQSKPFAVEADWSAASYYFTMAAFANNVNLQINGLQKDSLQGDAVIAKIMQKFGVKTVYNTAGIVLKKKAIKSYPDFKWDFLGCPDLAQSVAVTCAGLGVPAHLTGLPTLAIKETDRIAALIESLQKAGVRATVEEGNYAIFISGKIQRYEVPPQFKTYQDHRMAMAISTLGMLMPVRIESPGVVAKSYPAFWSDLEKLGFQISEVF